MNPPLIVAFIRAADWLPVTTSWAGGRNFLRVTMLVLLAGLAVDAQATPYAYLTTSGANVSVFDFATNAVERTLTLPGSAGTGVAVNRQSTRVYLAGVPSRGIQIPSLHVIDATTNTVLPSIALNGPSGAQWSGVAVNPAGDRVYVAQPTGRYIAVVDPGTSQVLTSIAVSGSPGNLALNASGTRLYVANASSGAGDSVLVLDTQTYATIATVPVTSGPSDLSINPQGTRLYVTHPQFNTVSVVDTTTNTLVTSLSMGFSPTALVVSRDGSKVYVSDYTFAAASVAVIDATTNTVVRSIPVGSPSNQKYPDG